MLEAGNVTTGAQFYTTLSRVHASRTKALTELVENAMSAGAQRVNIDLRRGAEMQTALAGNTKVLVVTSDTHIPDVRQTVQFAHSKNSSGHGLYNHLGIGSKVCMSMLGDDVQMFVFTKKGQHASLARMGSVVDLLTASSGQIGRAVWSGMLDEEGHTDIDWSRGDSLPKIHALCSHSPWNHPDENYRRTLQRMWSSFRAKECVTAFVFYAAGDAELPLSLNADGRLCVREGDGDRDVAEALGRMYLPAHPKWSEAAMPVITVQEHPVSYYEHASVVPLVTAVPTPLHLPGFAEPFAWVSCERLENTQRNLQPYTEKRSGAYFTYGNAKILNVDIPSAYFTGEVFGLTGTFDLNLGAFSRGDVRPAQYDEFVRFISCGVPEVAERVHAAVGLKTFQMWTPRDREMWSRLGTDVVSHVRINPNLVEVTPDKTQVTLRGRATSAMVPVLARLRLHVLRWGMADRDGVAFVAPYGDPEIGDANPVEAPRGRGLAIVPYVAPTGMHEVEGPAAKRQRRAPRAPAGTPSVPRVQYARKYRALVDQLRVEMDDACEALRDHDEDSGPIASILRRVVAVYRDHTLEA
jgi:hypothetical protein